MQTIKLIMADSLEEKEIVKNIIIEHHSYVPTYKSVGRKIDYLIYFKEEIIGMIGIGSSTYPPCKDMLSYLNISKEEYRRQFNTFANNWRFCLKKRINNVGTGVLKKLRNQSQDDWKNKYGDSLKYLITFVGGGHNGAVYRADNWNFIGQTSGLPNHKSSSMKWNTNKELKSLFVKPTGENRKLIFIKSLGIKH